MPEIKDETFACIDCDLMMAAPASLAPTDKLACPRCGHRLTGGNLLPIDSVLSTSFAALMLWVIAIFQPLLSFGAAGQSNAVSIFDIPFVLLDGEFYVASTLVLTFVIVLPVVYLGAIVALLIPQKRQWSSVMYSPVLLGKWLHYLSPWVMVEVFFLSILVALIKLTESGDIVYGIGFWSFLLFSLIFTYVFSKVDSYKIWYWVDRVRG